MTPPMGTSPSSYFISFGPSAGSLLHLVPLSLKKAPFFQFFMAFFHFFPQEVGSMVSAFQAEPDLILL